MWEPSDWIAPGALGVAALALAYAWWDRRGVRADSCRAALYDRQLSAFEEFVAIVRRYHDEVTAVERRSRERLDEARRQPEMLGVVAAEVTVPGQDAMNDVLSRPDIFSIGASGEDRCLWRVCPADSAVGG